MADFLIAGMINLTTHDGYFSKTNDCGSISRNGIDFS
jgi:hypothetical protein